MKRILEPELMLDPEQVGAYAQADFQEPHSNFIKLFKECFPNDNPKGLVLDLGCGPGDITFRFAVSFPFTTIHAIDGSKEMIKCAKSFLTKKPDLVSRIKFIHSTIQEYKPTEKYDFIISNSLLHHLPDPTDLWDGLKRFSKESAKIFIMDLYRPETVEEAKKLVVQYAKDEPKTLRRDFHKSLLAAFEVDEIKEQLEKAGLYFKVEQVSDRHLVVYGWF